MKRLTSQRIALWLWKRDGKPDGYAVGEANRDTYQREAEDVLEAIRTLGFRLVPQRERSRTVPNGTYRSEDRR
jgi:hypothetical protein